jgi:endogenous inhibitor of DNA gyrase (YacG/DUF329 family)
VKQPVPPKKQSLRCPICRKPAVKSSPDFPFCSDRCRTIDLGKWASGAYVIPVHDSDLDAADLPALLPGGSDQSDQEDE